MAGIAYRHAEYRSVVFPFVLFKKEPHRAGLPSRVAARRDGLEAMIGSDLVATFLWPGITAILLVLFIGAWVLVHGIFEVIGAVQRARR
jgi:uncharacterized membrane protein HdeD (DUF308 family)